MDWIAEVVELNSWDAVMAFGFWLMYKIVATDTAISRANSRYALFFIGGLSAALLGLRIYLNIA